MNAGAFKSVLLAMALLIAASALHAQAPLRIPPATRITLNVTGMDIRNFLRFIHQISGTSFVIAPDVQGRVTAVMENVSWEEALDAVLKTNGWIAEREGNVLRVMTLQAALRQAENRRRLALAALAAEPLITCTRRLNYASAGEAASLLRPLLSRRGRIAADVRTNMLIVTDVPSVLESIGLRSPAPSTGRCYQFVIR